MMMMHNPQGDLSVRLVSNYMKETSENENPYYELYGATDGFDLEELGEKVNKYNHPMTSRIKFQRNQFNFLLVETVVLTQKIGPLHDINLR